MTPSAIAHSPAVDPATLITICRPGPGYRLGFVSIPLFLERCLTIPIGDAFRTLPPLSFHAHDFRELFLGPDEITTLNQFKALKKQIEWMAGRYAVKQLARQFTNGRPSLESTRVAYRAKGAPYLANAPSLSLSISHSWDYAVAGLGLIPANVLGIDLEKIRPESRNTLLRAAFTAREADALKHMADEDLFLRWTAKEAYLKYIGQGFHESLKRIEILDNTIFDHTRPVPSLTLCSHLPLPAYVFSMVC